MSHITTINVEIRDLDALKDAVAELGCEWREGQTTYAAHMSGQRADHAIHIPGVEYEVGVSRRPGGYSLNFDSWGPGQGIVKRLGPDCKKLVQTYAVCKATAAAKAKGYLVRRQAAKGGAIKLVITGM